MHRLRDGLPLRRIEILDGCSCQGFVYGLEIAVAIFGNAND